MSTDKPNIHTKVQTITAVVGTLVGILGIAITWYYARTPSVRAGEETRSVPATQMQAPQDSPREPLPEQPSQAATQTSPRVDGEPPRPEERRVTERASPREEGGAVVPEEPAAPIELTLQNREQRTVLSDQVSLAVEFTRIQAEEIVTLRINTAGGQPTSYAILGSGDRFELTSAGKDYFVYILRVDPEAEIVQLRIARAL